MWGAKGSLWEDNKVNLINHVKASLGDDFNSSVEDRLRKFISNFHSKKKSCKVQKDSFIQRNLEWLSSPFICFVTRSTGRPVRNICANKQRTRVSRTKEIRDYYKIDELAAALEIAYIKAGYRGAGKLIRKIQSS